MSGDENSSNSLVPVLVGELVQVAKDSPDMKAAGGNTAACLRIVTTTIKHALLPLAVVNFAIEKAQNYFNVKFEGELADKAKSIPEEFIAEPKASIAGPALQALAYAHEEPPLKEMYLNLLRSAMDSRVSMGVHPAFVEIIKQLSPDEIPVLNVILEGDFHYPIGQIKKGGDGNTYEIVLTNLINFKNIDGSPFINPKMPALINNWVRLGLVETTYSNSLANPKGYENLECRPEFIALKELHEAAGHEVTLIKGILFKTAFGTDFARAVGIYRGAQ